MCELCSVEGRKHGALRASLWRRRKQWPSTTARYGIANGSTPKAGSVAIQYVGVYGHAMYVEAVNGDGTITVSDYNNNSDGLGWGRYHHYSRSAAGLTYIYF